MDAEFVPSAGPAGTVKSLQKGLAVLDLIRDGGVLRTTDVAARLQIDKATASRLLQTLTRAGYATRLEDRRFGPGPKLTARRAGPNQPRIRERARPLLDRLVQLTGETAHVAILADDQVLYLDRAVPETMLKVDRAAGSLGPLHCTALGKVFLAFADVPLPAVLAPATPRTVTDAARLAAELREAASRGFTADDEGYCPGVRCVAAPLRDGGEVVAALSLSGPTLRIDPTRLMVLGEVVRDMARRF